MPAFSSVQFSSDSCSEFVYGAQAAERGVPDALHNQGLLHLDAPSVAVDLFEQAAHAGSHQPYFNLGVAYLQGRGVAANATRASEWFQLDGSAQALHILSTIHRDTFKDTEGAKGWRLKAAQVGKSHIIITSRLGISKWCHNRDLRCLLRPRASAGCQKKTRLESRVNK